MRAEPGDYFRFRCCWSLSQLIVYAINKKITSCKCSLSYFIFTCNSWVTEVCCSLQSLQHSRHNWVVTAKSIKVQGQCLIWKKEVFFSLCLQSDSTLHFHVLIEHWHLEPAGRRKRDCCTFLHAKSAHSVLNDRQTLNDKRVFNKKTSWDFLREDIVLVYTEIAVSYQIFWLLRPNWKWAATNQ